MKLRNSILCAVLTLAASSTVIPAASAGDPRIESCRIATARDFISKNKDKITKDVNTALEEYRKPYDNMMNLLTNDEKIFVRRLVRGAESTGDIQSNEDKLRTWSSVQTKILGPEQKVLNFSMLRGFEDFNAVESAALDRALTPDSFADYDSSWGNPIPPQPRVDGGYRADRYFKDDNGHAYWIPTAIMYKDYGSVSFFRSMIDDSSEFTSIVEKYLPDSENYPLTHQFNAAMDKFYLDYGKAIIPTVIEVASKCLSIGDQKHDTPYSSIQADAMKFQIVENQNLIKRGETYISALEQRIKANTADRNSYTDLNKKKEMQALIDKDQQNIEALKKEIEPAGKILATQQNYYNELLALGKRTLAKAAAQAAASTTTTPVTTPSSTPAVTPDSQAAPTPKPTNTSKSPSATTASSSSAPTPTPKPTPAPTPTSPSASTRTATSKPVPTTTATDKPVIEPAQIGVAVAATGG